MESMSILETRHLFANLATYWASFVDCDKRLRSEGPFLQRVLDSYADGIVLDAALGMGCESIFLLQNGFRVISNEIDRALRDIARNNARRVGLNLDIRGHDWRSMSSSYIGPQPSCLILMGNSLALLNDVDEVAAALNEFYQLLLPGGCLVVDQRNYDYIRSEKRKILEGEFRYSGEYIYCGTQVQGRPIQIDETKVKFGYFHAEKGCVGQLDMLMFGSQQLCKMLEHCGFVCIREYCDFESQGRLNCDFLTYVAIKPRRKARY